MAHKTMIDGVAYEISGGKTLVNGTAYNIDHGKTLVGGTAYEVGFGPAFDGTVYLRPTADISVNHNVYPAGSAGYACIDESVADGDATYIYSSSYAGSDFTLSGTIPDGMKVTSAKAVYVAKYKNISNNFTPVVVQIKIDGATYNTPLCYEISEKYERYERVFDRGVEEGSSVKPMYDAINALGSGDISLTVALNSVGDGSDKSTNLCITQLYIELTCEP